MTSVRRDLGCPMPERSSSAMDIKLREKAGEVRDPHGRRSIPCGPWCTSWIFADRDHDAQRSRARGDLFPEDLKHIVRIHPAEVILTPTILPVPFLIEAVTREE